MRRTTLLALIAGLCLAGLPAGAGAASTRPDEPVTLTGAEAGPLQGLQPDRILGFAYSRQGGGGHRGKRLRGSWTQVPVQIDERKLVDFGTQPAAGAVGGGVDGTVYGTSPSGLTALQYADPGTFVGADPDTRFDADDELTFMAGDSGSRAPKQRAKPRQAGWHGATRIRVGDPLSSGKPTYLYLFNSTDLGLKPDAGRDYVDYDFNLTSGPYKTTYRRGEGPNPETSRISTDNYEIGFSDRWYYDRLAIRAGDADGVDVLDGFKFGFGPGNCGRSEATFNAGEGAFVANIDGPVRAIRSYVGANSGPRAERTHIFYRDRDEIITDLRVHPVSGPLLYRDMSAAGLGMQFRSSSNPIPVTVDGVADQVSSAPADWQLWSGPQGSLFAADRLESSFADELAVKASSFYLDDATPSYQQCWGDSHAYGQFGYRSTADMPNTDPALGAAATLQTTTTEILSPPGLGTGMATNLSRQIDAPLNPHSSALERP
jgi:hypothetical protein